MAKHVSIIIRTKNEERWIAQCLRSVFGQGFTDFEVILVDNESADKTIEKAKQFPIQAIVPCRGYRPGKALNLGIQRATGEYIVCLSGHCIPVNDRWLGNLLRNFDAEGVAGVYGRQEPMSFTPPADKRDLTVVFGLDRKIQQKDSFFHNANSMIPRRVWERIPFDEQATNIEDRIWARAVLREGHKIIYEPEASVYHYHGIHQNGDVERCANVVRIMESLQDHRLQRGLDVEKLNVVAIIPVRGPIRLLGGKPLLAYTIERARAARYVKRVIVAADDPETMAVATALGAEVPFQRDPAFSRDHVDIVHALHYCLEQVEQRGIFPDLVVSLEVTFPFRPHGLLDDMLLHLAHGGFDSVVAGRRENRSIWKEQTQQIVQLDEGVTPRALKEATFIELRGVACVTHPELLRLGHLLGERIGIYEVQSPYAHLEVRSEADFRMAEGLVEGAFA